MISNLHYISQGKTPAEHLENIQRLCKAGANWVQLRLKDETFEVCLETAKAARKICDRSGTILIINDQTEIAGLAKADGVHLGKQDQCPLEARKILGPDAIIGGTANTIEDCEILVQKEVDYIGLGPFRFTTTKKNLSPVLGTAGYSKILESLGNIGSNIPVIAIGGITPADIPELTKTGLHGVAISGCLTSQEEPEQMLQAIKHQFAEKQL